MWATTLHAETVWGPLTEADDVKVLVVMSDQDVRRTHEDQVFFLLDPLDPSEIYGLSCDAAAPASGSVAPPTHIVGFSGVLGDPRLIDEVDLEEITATLDEGEYVGPRPVGLSGHFLVHRLGEDGSCI